MNFTLNKEQWFKIGKGALVAAAGALATYILQAVGQLDFGTLTPLVVAGASVLANYLRKIASPEKKEEN